MEPGKVQGRLPGSAYGSDRGKSGSRRKRNRRETEESSQADQDNRSGFRFAEELGSNRREEKGDWKISQETEATCKESSVKVDRLLLKTMAKGGAEGANIRRRSHISFPTR